MGLRKSSGARERAARSSCCPFTCLLLELRGLHRDGCSEVGSNGRHAGRCRQRGLVAGHRLRQLAPLLQQHPHVGLRLRQTKSRIQKFKQHVSAPILGIAPSLGMGPLHNRVITG